ncbi:ABSCISIC ACID-INSENSITIVE 5-like protein 2 [Zea mays]|uniref:ABSCISIC ACID-INSENSITIVE 5-like protein 2 n=1 Tax=Zea mays TaxID=4577 RepID=A0A1D6IP03_MAIZE|nr:ABSCISIC ACID-INSENSITIVE 5-like protein 2 [Zea mays]
MGVQTMSSHSHGDDGRRGLPRQGSVYGLTLTEVETQLGEPLRTMNLDDLLRTVLPASAAAAAGPPPPPAPAAKKTVDEVWRDIQSAGGGGGGRQPSMGEMTLEDFLSRAGVAVDAAPHWMHQYPQAYTNELENKVARLEEENKRLIELKVLKPLEPLEPPPAEQNKKQPPPQPKRKQPQPPPPPPPPIQQLPPKHRHDLRRTNSATF